MIESGDGFTGNRQYEYRAGGSTAGTKTDSIDFQIMILARQSEEIVYSHTSTSDKAVQNLYMEAYKHPV
jgi:hypothetical protein